MTISQSVYKAEHIHLTALDTEKDAPLFSTWSDDLDFARFLRIGLPRPLALFQTKKMIEELQKSMDEKGATFPFAIHLNGEEDRLLGMVVFHNLEWSNGMGRLEVCFGEPQDRHLYEHEVFNLTLAYAFEELNLFRLEVEVPEYDGETVRLLERGGFHLDVRRRNAAFRRNQLWEQRIYSLLREEWQRSALEVEQ